MSYTCPRCGAVSHNPNDERERYCGRCRQFEARDFSPVGFGAWLIGFGGCCDWRILHDRYAAIREQMYNVAFVTGWVGDRDGFGDLWEYDSMAEARAALHRWHFGEFEGLGEIQPASGRRRFPEPTGWRRHPASGRRVSRSADEVDGDGHVVGAVGVTYTRE